jgi:hypothetical protein
MSVTQTPFAPSLDEHTAPPEPRNAPRIQYNVAIGYLRAFVTMLVLAHHAALAYHPFAPAPSASLIAEPRLWPAFPVVDAQRWNGFGLLVGFNDTFFMSLMFFLSGLFVWKSLERKGSGAFLRDRMFRLGLPFIVAAALLAPLAYYPTYLRQGSVVWMVSGSSGLPSATGRQGRRGSFGSCWRSTASLPCFSC